MGGRGELSLGRILGVRVGVSWGLLLVSALVTLTLALNQYPAAFPGHGPLRYWAAGVATTLLFAVSILVHELGHATVARGEDVEVEGVTLWMFGGVARLASPPPTAAAEARIALAGPAATGIASGVFWVLAAVTEADSHVFGFASRLSAPFPEFPSIEPKVEPLKNITFTIAKAPV